MEECNGSTHEIEVVDPCGLPQTLTGAIYLIGEFSSIEFLQIRHFSPEKRCPICISCAIFLC